MASTGAARPGGRPARSLRRTFAAMVLLGEMLVVGFATLVAKDLSGVRPGVALAVGGAVMLLCLVAAGLLRSPVGYALGWLVQVLLVVSGWWVHTMVVLGLVFAGLWLTALVQGRKMDALTAQREREAAAAPGDTPGA